MTPEERAEKREGVIQGMVAKGYTRERAEELVGTITKALFGPGGRFAAEQRAEERTPRCECVGGPHGGYTCPDCRG
jgi:hypothetical protein